MKIKLITLLLISVTFSVRAQYSHQDSLRGSITPQRAWWDLQHYDLSVKIDTAKRTIAGTNIITYKVTGSSKDLQLDLQEPMQITSAIQNKQQLQIRRDGSAHFITITNDQPIGSEQILEINFEGAPKEAVKAPWDGGFSWKIDENGNPFIATSNQGIGSSVWWPCKDHPADEPDKGATLHFTVPQNLMAIGNGRLTSVKKAGKGFKTYSWNVTNPINDYGINLNVGDYVKFSEVYQGEKGPLDMTYYVLSYNLEKAKEHFKDARRTIEAFEHWFGPYPFYEDGYKLVEVPYLGMEHQSSVTYGNGYIKGYKGRDLSLTGYGLLWDYIIIHESGHEWFANNITYRDVADMWIHESFTCYSESLFTEYHYGKDTAAAYVRGMRNGIHNTDPIIGDYNVNNRGSDLYNKGSNVLHTLRQLISDDAKWRSILRGLNSEFYHQTVTTEQVENYIMERSGLDLEKFFDQYLRDIRVPVLEYFIYDSRLAYRWTNCIEGFDMPIKISVDGVTTEIRPQTTWNFRSLGIVVNDPNSIKVDPDYYVYPFWISGK